VGKKIGFRQSVYLSEKATAHRNFALAYFMASEGSFPESVKIEDALDFYFQLCSLEITAEKLAIVAGTYANYGVCPLTNKRVISKETAKYTMQMLFSSGMYNYSGTWAGTVGLPAKSGVSGSIFIIVPKTLGICIFSPRLDENGNSVRGIEFATKMADHFGWNVFDILYSSNSYQGVAHNRQ
jgi:glutaminase